MTYRTEPSSDDARELAMRQRLTVLPVSGRGAVGVCHVAKGRPLVEAAEGRL